MIMNTRGFWKKPLCVKLFIPRLMVPIHMRKDGQNPQEQGAEFFPDSVDLWGNAADLGQGWSSLS